MLENIVTLADFNSVSIWANQLWRRLLREYGKLQPIAVNAIALLVVSEKHSFGFRPRGYVV